MAWPTWLEAWDHETFLEIHRRLHAFDAPAVDSYFRFANELGNGFVLVAVVALWVALRPSARAALRGIAQAGLAVATTTVTTHLLKGAFDHPRPRSVFAGRFDDGDIVELFGTPARVQAFPSGHTATAFALALLVAVWAAGIPSAPRRWFVRVLAFLLAASTGLARIYAASHFPTDVLAGVIVGLLGAALALLVVRTVPRSAGLRPVGVR
jgi:undecaprenyl-diphosphatase